jgi:hypothetical protein
MSIRTVSSPRCSESPGGVGIGTESRGLTRVEDKRLAAMLLRSEFDASGWLLSVALCLAECNASSSCAVRASCSACGGSARAEGCLFKTWTDEPGFECS